MWSDSYLVELLPTSLCLYAERQTGRTAWNTDAAAALFRCGSEDVQAALVELYQQQVCTPVGVSTVEIGERFWSYEKPPVADGGADRASYVQQVRRMFLRPACVRASFSAADERLSADFHRRGIPLCQLQRAICLGCARKYLTLLNGQSSMRITSVHYFTGAVDEVAATTVGDSYWLHVQWKAEQLERGWIASRTGGEGKTK